MLLYHGSNLTIDEPRLIEQTRGLDFGAGFYLTTNEAQAALFSWIVANRRKSGIATVNEFEFDLEAAEKTLAIRRFESANKEWLNFVTDNRLKAYQGDAYDIVIGAVANDTVMPTIQALMGGFLSEEAALITLKTSIFADQICLKSDKTLALLRFIRSYALKSKGAPRMARNISSVITMITPGIINLLMENRGLSLEDTSGVLYNSQLYKSLEDEETKVWRLGYPILYDMLEEELATGKITFPEEQT